METAGSDTINCDKFTDQGSTPASTSSGFPICASGDQVCSTNENACYKHPAECDATHYHQDAAGREMNNDSSCPLADASPKQVETIPTLVTVSAGTAENIVHQKSADIMHHDGEDKEETNSDSSKVKIDNLADLQPELTQDQQAEGEDSFVDAVSDLRMDDTPPRKNVTDPKKLHHRAKHLVTPAELNEAQKGQESDEEAFLDGRGSINDAGIQKSNGGAETGGAESNIEEEEEEEESYRRSEYRKEETTQATIDDERMRAEEQQLSDTEKQERMKRCRELKSFGNEEYKQGNYNVALDLYTDALTACLVAENKDRAILYANRAAVKMSLGQNDDALVDCTRAVDLDDGYVRARLRRAEVYEKLDKLEEALADYQKVLERDPSVHKARAACVRLPGQISERNEKLKTEMLGKLKELGNLVLRPFGLSTDNFKVQQDPATGGYSVNFQK